MTVRFIDSMENIKKVKNAFVGRIMNLIDNFFLCVRVSQDQTNSSSEKVSGPLI